MLQELAREEGGGQTEKLSRQGVVLGSRAVRKLSLSRGRATNAEETKQVVLPGTAVSVLTLSVNTKLHGQ